MHLLLGAGKWKYLRLTESKIPTTFFYALYFSGAKVDACTDQGRSSLLYACSKNHQSIAKMLLNEGANVKLEDKLGRVFTIY